MRQLAQDSSVSIWRSLYKVAGVCAITVVLIGIIEILITFLPGGGRTDPSSMTVIDWFTFFRDNWFIGLRNLGLLNMFMVFLSIPVFFALFGSHRQVNAPYAALAMIISYIGVAVFFATNRAFPMLDISNQYWAATSETQRAILAGAGKAMLSVGQSHTPGTFLGFFLSEIAGIMISLVMLKGRIFSMVAAYSGIVSYVSLLIFEICSSFVPALFSAAIIFAGIGGLMSMVWNILIALRLFKLEGQAISVSPSI